MAMVAPAYTPKSSYIANAVVPSFGRPVTTDATFVADIGMFPYRKSFYTCNDEINSASLSTLNQCDPTTKYIAYTEGLSIGASSLVTKWVRDDPRLAYEVGLEMHMDVLHAGPSWFYQTETPDVSIVADRLNGRSVRTNEENVIMPSYTWSIRPQTGASVGFRHAPDAMPLSRGLIEEHLGSNVSVWFYLFESYGVGNARSLLGGSIVQRHRRHVGGRGMGCESTSKSSQ